MIDTVFLIMEGIVWTCTSDNGARFDSRHYEHLEKGQYLGRKLLQWVLTPTSAMYNLSKLPISSKTLNTHTKVEAFALMANDLKQIWHCKLSRIGQEQLQSKASACAQRIWHHNHPKMDDSNRVGGGSRKLQNPAKPALLLQSNSLFSCICSIKLVFLVIRLLLVWILKMIMVELEKE